MKKLGLLALMLSIGFAGVGCEPPKKKEADKKPVETAPADKGGATETPAPDAKPTETPAPETK